MRVSQEIIGERITPRDLREKGVKYILDKIKVADGYYITNTERDLSQSDYKNRIMPRTQILVSEDMVCIRTD